MTTTIDYGKLPPQASTSWKTNRWCSGERVTLCWHRVDVRILTERRGNAHAERMLRSRVFVREEFRVVVCAGTGNEACVAFRGREMIWAR